MVEAVRYRVGQFLRALTAQVPEEEIKAAMYVLTPEAQDLFRRQAVQDQHHALAVYHTLRQAGHTNPQLLAAALLHDVGKAVARLPSWQRAFIVLLERFAPRLLAYLSRGEPQDQALNPLKGWRHTFVVHAHHPEIGARRAREAGCSPLTVTLIRRHQDRISCCQTEEDHLLALLQMADNQN